MSDYDLLKSTFMWGFLQSKENIRYKNPFDLESENPIKRAQAELFSRGYTESENIKKHLEILEYYK